VPRAAPLDGTRQTNRRAVHGTAQTPGSGTGAVRAAAPAAPRRADEPSVDLIGRRTHRGAAGHLGGGGGFDSRPSAPAGPQRLASTGPDSESRARGELRDRRPSALRADGDDPLAEVPAGEQVVEVLGSPLQTGADVLAVADLALLEPAAHIGEELIGEPAGEFGLDETSHQQRLRQYVAHERTRAVGTLGQFGEVVVG